MNKLSKLDAVNLLLSTISQAPVNAITGNIGMDTSRAMTMLDTTSLEVQTQGWLFNTVANVSLPVDEEGHITVGDDVVNVYLDPNTYTSTTYDVILRGSRLFNRVGNTYQFTDGLAGTIVSVLDWDSLPQHARTYIAIKAARRFQDDSTGSDARHKYNETDELNAWVSFKARETKQGHYNFLGQQ